jgi:hypothetical protein
VSDGLSHNNEVKGKFRTFACQNFYCSEKLSESLWRNCSHP